MPAATTRLFYEDCSLPHLRAQSAHSAALLIEDGFTVCVDDVDSAVEALILLGLTREAAEEQISFRAPL